VSTPHPTAWEEAKRTDEEQRRRSQYQQDWRDPGTADRFLANDAELLRRLFQGKVPADHVEEYVRRLSEPGALSAALNYYRADRPDAEVGKVEVPTLYVWSTGDVAVGSTAALATGSWGSRAYSFRKIEDATHWIPEEIPDVLTSLLLDHLEGR
jgi:pimeloyl-ACP methyl ester carboxylesterase